MLFPRFVWVTYSKNYTNAVLASNLYNGCTAQQLFESLDGTFSLVPAVITTNHSQQVLAAPEIITLAKTAFQEVRTINTLSTWMGVGIGGPVLGLRAEPTYVTQLT